MSRWRRRGGSARARKLICTLVVLGVLYIGQWYESRNTSDQTYIWEDTGATESSTSTAASGSASESAEATEVASAVDGKVFATNGGYISTPPITAEDIPDYSGEDYYTVNDNIPYFTEDELTTDEFELYSVFDQLGRCQTAFANVSVSTMPTEERGDISSVTPTGWKQAAYQEVLEEESSPYLYNRSHLIAYSLCGENANPNNLITGTRHFNLAMTDYEIMVADYVEETQGHVLYRVTPLFEGDNLVCKGVLMEAQSVEDGGEGITYCVFLYNTQPGVTIDYTTGDSEGTPYIE